MKAIVEKYPRYYLLLVIGRFLTTISEITRELEISFGYYHLSYDKVNKYQLSGISHCLYFILHSTNNTDEQRHINKLSTQQRYDTDIKLGGHVILRLRPH